MTKLCGHKAQKSTCTLAEGHSGDHAALAVVGWESLNIGYHNMSAPHIYREAILASTPIGLAEVCSSCWNLLDRETKRCYRCHPSP